MLTSKSFKYSLLPHADRRWIRAAANGDRRLREALFALEQGETVAHVGTWITSLGAPRRVVWSRECYRLFGIPEGSQFTLEDYFSKVHPDDRARVRAACDAAMREGVGYELDYRIVHVDGGVRWLRTRAVVERSAGDGSLCVVNVCQDVTEERRTRDELKASEAQLRHAQKMELVGRMVAGLAHDFNNALSIIGMHAALALDDLPSDHPIQSDLEQIAAATELAATLAHQLLALSRRQPTEAPQNIDLDRTVLLAERLLRSLLGKDVSLRLALAANGATVHADPSQVEQVLLNLVINARDAMPDGGTLVIETAEVDVDVGRGAACRRHVRLSVTDSGEGMDAPTQARIFEPFFTTKDPDHGTGLGLSTVRSIVEQDGGRIAVTSAPGRGTRFDVLFPRVSEATHPCACAAAQ